MHIARLLPDILLWAPIVYLIYHSYRRYQHQQRQDRRLRSAVTQFRQTADLANVVQSAILSGQSQRASEAAAQIERLARQWVTGKTPGQVPCGRHNSNCT